MRRGSQRYIGGFVRELDAARAYDMARVKLGPYKETDLNFTGIDYEEELRPLTHLSFDEYMRHLRLTRRKAKDEPTEQRVVVMEDVLLIDNSDARCTGDAAFCSIFPNVNE